MFIKFWDFHWWLSKFSFHHKWNEAWLLVINWYLECGKVLRSYPHGIFAAGGTYVPTQEKKKKKKENINNFVGLLSSAQSSSRNDNFVSTSNNLPKNRNWTFPIVRYFTLKLEIASNILWVIVGSLALEARRYLYLALNSTPPALSTLGHHES